MGGHESVETSGILLWPYRVSYGKESEMHADVLVPGGRPSGCMAAISAARKGLKVIMVDKGHSRRSGSGSGVDHFLTTPTPRSELTPEDCVD